MSDDLLDLIAELLAAALDVDSVDLELPALGVVLRGHAARRTVGRCLEPVAIAELCISTSQAELRIARRAGLPAELVSRARRFAERLGVATSRIMPPAGHLPVREELSLIREHRVLEALYRSGWNVADAARALRVGKLYVYRITQAVRDRRRAKTGEVEERRD